MSSSTELKDQLLFISDKIDETIKQYRQSKVQEIQSKQQEDLLKDTSPKNINKLNSLKSQIDILQKNLEDVYNIEKINYLESAIKKKEKILKELKNEGNTLNNVLKEQNKGINEYLSKFDTTKELRLLSEQVKQVKENYHYYKETYKEVYNTIKLQKNKIDALEKRCQIIRQNIDFHKKKQMKEVQKNMKEENNIGEAEENEGEGDITKMEEIEKNLIEQINIEEKNFRIEINEQNDIMANINSDIHKIVMQIKNLQQEKKMDIILKKNKARGKSSTRYIPYSNQNFNIIKNRPNRCLKKRLSNNNHNPRSNYIGILKNNKISNEKRNMLRTPNFLVRDKKKPFEIKKFNDLSNNFGRDNSDEKSNTMFTDNKKKKHLSFSNNGNTGIINYEKIFQKKNNKGLSTLKEIEMLKNDIQFTLKYNIVQFDSKGEVIKNQKDKNDLNKVKKIPANKTGCFRNGLNDTSKQKEKDEDIRNDFGYNYRSENNYKKTVLIQNEKRINDYQLNINEKSNEENNKRKPFDKIIFK